MIQLNRQEIMKEARIMNIEKAKIGLVCYVKNNVGISLWQAFKLRIAGKAYLPIAEKIGDLMMEQMKNISGEQI